MLHSVGGYPTSTCDPWDVSDIDKGHLPLYAGLSRMAEWGLRVIIGG